ncbi:hypothetical protein FPOAC1_010112 [Fusarium poae]|uniref:hypothetical protein n=1 Tax=Fusarium poae TaxID=36050 RepID=UPI001CE82666|nr:hypothetical protein FPOAC1_010112 [Fusarium poae]KAG8670679.1 hypothetical protein FPOAC1_010112 [Fusarium poae]
MLALSSTADTDRLRGIVEYTAAIVFLGTPHRGSPEFSAIGERARVVLNSLGFQTTAAILDALRLGNNDLQRAHESFTRLWQKYDFRVKTIQEGLGLSGFNFGVLGAKVVPDSSSIIGDPREHAETLQANHFGICRFRSGTDPNYIKVSGEIRDIYSRIETAQTQCHDLVKERGPSQLRINSDRTIYPSNVEPEIGENNPERLTPSMLAAFIESLGFEGMHYRQESISPPSDNTLQWLFENPVYGSWRTSPNPSDRLLFIKGNPGSGKSVLMKEAVRDMQSTSNEKFASASFFVNARATCIDYMHIPELDDLATARQKMRMRSSVSSSGRSASVLSERQKLNTPQHNRQPKGILKSLQEMPAPDSLDLVESWILGEFPTSNSFPVVESWSDSPPLDSVGIASQALPDYPALLVYSVNELCYHIMEAMNFNESVFELPERLNDAATWQRLADLGINKDIFTQAIDIKRLQHFFKHSSILLQSRRVRKHRQNTEEPPRQGHGVFYEVLKRVRGLGDLGKHKRNGSEDFQQPRITRRDTSSIQSRRRPRSIASFSSADSHRRAQSV